MPDSQARTCPTCATVMPASFPQGLCPRCMLAQAKAGASEVPTSADMDGPENITPVAPQVSGSSSVRHAGVPSLETLRELFPDLDILDLLGAGGMGAVYQARQPRLNRLVALKIMVCPPGHAADFALRFEREAQVLARLNHPHIVTIHDFGDIPSERTGDDPIFYFLMEHVDGTDLGQLIKSKELKPAQALAIVPQICAALQYAHDQGITHRDIKPANILIDQNGTVKIADFGLAKMGGGSVEEAMMTGLTQTGTAMGTPHYMAPEQWENPDQVDHRADIYALGVVFYEMLTGERPAGVFEPPSKRAHVDRKLDGVVMRAMEKDRDKRYQQASEINDAVSRLSVSRKSRQSAAKGVPPNASKRSSPWIVLSLMVLIGLGGSFFWPRVVSDSKDKQPPSPASAPWIQVDFDRADPASFAKSAQLEGQQLRLQHGVWYPTPDKRFKNVAQRVTLTWREDTENLSLCFGPVASMRSKYYPDKHFAKLHTTEFGNRYCQIGHFTDRTTSLTGYAKPVDPPINPGDPVVLLFATIGDNHYASLNGKLQHSVTSPLPASPEGYEMVVSAYEASLDKYEYLPLDGLSEAEALRLLGIDSAVPKMKTASPAPAPSSSTPLAGRLQALGTHRKGQAIDLTKAAGISDFTQVFLHDYGWVGLRADGATLSSDDRGERKNIARICPGLEQCFGLIDIQGRLEAIHPRPLSWVPPLVEEVNRTGVVDFAMDTHHLIVLLKDGSVRVGGNHYDHPEALPEWMNQERWPRPPPQALQDVISIAITPMSASTVTRDGRLWTWGEAKTAIPPNAEALQGQYATVVSTSSGLYDARLKDGRVVSFNLSMREAKITAPGAAAVESLFGGYRPLHRRTNGDWFAAWGGGDALPPLLKAVHGQPSPSFSLSVFHEGGEAMSAGLLQIVAD